MDRERERQPLPKRGRMDIKDKMSNVKQKYGKNRKEGSKDQNPLM
jgi:hypothetical protein